MAKAVSKVGRPVWAEVSTSALKYNLEAIRKFVNPEDEQRATPRLVLSIVKGNGYGHGGPEVAKILEKAGSDWFGVTSAAEGIEVRKAGVKKPILVLTSFWPGEEKNLLKYDLTPVVHRIEQLAQLNRAAAKDDKRDPLSFHLKIDSGMNRLGIASNEIDEFAAQLAKCQSLRLGGVMTHFASSEAFASSPVGAQTREQEEHFFVALERLRALGVDPGIVHLANSAAIASRPETWGDMVRPGVILYGYHPGYDPQEKREEAEKKLPLKPAMSLRTRIINLRNISAGAGVGYGMKFVATRPSVIAVLAAGYGDGVHRSLGTKRKCAGAREAGADCGDRFDGRDDDRCDGCVGRRDWRRRDDLRIVWRASVGHECGGARDRDGHLGFDVRGDGESAEGVHGIGRSKEATK